MAGSDQFPDVGPDLHHSRRHLPHYQGAGCTLFVTWNCVEGEHLEAPERAIVLDCIKHFHFVRYNVCAAVVMPDHVHILISPLEREPRKFWNLGFLLKGMKGVSARRINQLRGRAGSIWQDERYDREVRSPSDFTEKWRYILLNPVRAGLVDQPDKWDGLWIATTDDGWFLKRTKD